MVILRAMRAGDLPGADLLREGAEFNQSLEDWRRLLAWDPDGCLVAEEGGKIVGTITTTRYGHDLAWIGMMLVAPEFRRRGIGRALLRQALDLLQERGIRSVGLDATPLGKHMYDQMGFFDCYRLTRWQGSAPVVEPAVDTVQLDDGGKLAALDRRAFGVDRTHVLRDLVAQPPGCVIAPHAGTVDGYACLRPGAKRWHLGPVVAINHAAAEKALQAAFAHIPHQAVEIDIPDINADLIRRYEFTPVRPFIRMVRGRPLPNADISTYFAIAGPEIG